MKATDRSRGAAGGSVAVSIKAKKTTYAVIRGDEPVQATLVLGDANDGLGGACGETGYTAGQCTFNSSGTRLRCRRTPCERTRSIERSGSGAVGPDPIFQSPVFS